MSGPKLPPELDPATERALAAGCYNLTWTFLEQTDRSPEDIDRMIHAAHASSFHWEAIGGPANRCRGEWLCSRVYAVLGRGEPALWHARRALTIVDAGGDGFEDWDRAAVYEALVRAHAVAGDPVEAEDVARALPDSAHRRRRRRGSRGHRAGSGQPAARLTRAVLRRAPR